MKDSFRIAGFLVLGLGLVAATGGAATLCTTDAGVDVTTIGSCMVDGLTFSNFAVSGATLSVNGVTTGVTGDEVDLGFQISNIGSGGDIFLSYVVSGGISGIDVHETVLGSGGTVEIGEVACDSAFVQGNCPDTPLGTLDAISSSGTPVFDVTTFASTNTVYISKDIQFNTTNGTAFLSDFVNSQITGVPEPMTLSLMGVGLLGLGLLGRKLRK